MIWLHLGLNLEDHKSETGKKWVPVRHSFMSDMELCKHAFCFGGGHYCQQKLIRNNFSQLFVQASEGKSRYWSNSTMTELIYGKYTTVFPWENSN